MPVCLVSPHTSLSTSYPPIHYNRMRLVGDSITYSVGPALMVPRSTLVRVPGISVACNAKHPPPWTPARQPWTTRVSHQNAPKPEPRSTRRSAGRSQPHRGSHRRKRHRAAQPGCAVTPRYGSTGDRAGGGGGGVCMYVRSMSHPRTRAAAVKGATSLGNVSGNMAPTLQA